MNNAYKQKMKKLISIPSVSSDDDINIMRDCANYLASLLQDIQFPDVQVLESGKYPMVYAQWVTDKTKPVLLMYGHYDVVSAEPLTQWNSDPYELVERDGRFYGRGCSDMKGPIIASLAALDEFVHSSSDGFNIKVLFEGTEEYSSLFLKDFVKQNKELLACNYVFNPDGGMPSPDAPAIEAGFRGNCGAVLTIHGPQDELHSGEYGGAVVNPVDFLSKVIAGMKDDNGRIQLPGFYDNVKEETKLNKGDSQYYEKYPLFGEENYSPYEQTHTRPSCDVVHIHAGANKMAVPTSAEARFSFRIVVDQSPSDIEAAFRRYLEKVLPSFVQWDLSEWKGYGPFRVDLDSKVVRDYQAAVLRTWGKAPALSLGGGGLPVAAIFSDELAAKALLTGFSLHEDGIHGPNESVLIENLSKGKDTIRTFLEIFFSND